MPRTTGRARRRSRAALTAVAMAAVVVATGGARPRPAHVERGSASWYGPGLEGRPTASGRPFDPRALTAAHPALPLGTRALVTDLENGRSVEVEIDARGPYVPGRVIDLSLAAAERLGMVEAGVAPVLVEAERGPP